MSNSNLSGTFCPGEIPVESLRFVPSSDNKFTGVYAQCTSGCWKPVNIGLTSVPTLQEVRNADRNISMSVGSYENAHFYLRSAEGNNTTTAFYTDAKGGAIQSGDTHSYTALNLQPLGGLLTYNGVEIATQTWVQTNTPNLQQVATKGNSYNGDLLLGSAGNELWVGSGPAGKGSGNTRLGNNTLAAIADASWNTAIGSGALASMKYGLNMVAIGEFCMPDFIGTQNASYNNTAVGDSAGQGMTQGNENVILGAAAGYCGGSLRPRGDRNTFLGSGAGNASTITAGTTALGSSNIFVGYNAGGGPVENLIKLTPSCRSNVTPLCRPKLTPSADPN